MSAPRHPPRPGPGPKGKGKEKAATSSLNLSNTVLSIPPSLSPSTYPDLHKLDLSNCGLTSLAFVREAKNTLTWLNVSGNNLDGPGAWDGVEELKGLFVLNASNCGLTRVPSVVASLSSLKALVLSHNKLTTLGPHIARLPDLNSLIVSHNTLTSLPISLTTLPSLKKLSASHNALLSSSLPDLSPLSNLREVKLSSNPTLLALPDHFASWGKADDEQGKPGRGLEIVDLGQCGFADWTGLRALGGQTNVVNLGLKGTGVGEEGIAENGFEAFRDKLTILLPALRILNDVRFDAKFQDLKKRRSLRAPEEAILDAGPMALALNDKRERPVVIPTSMIDERDKRKRRRALGRLRGAEEAAGKKGEGSDEEGGGEGEEPKKKSRKERTEEEAGNGEEGVEVLPAEEETPVVEAKKSKKRRKESAPDVDGEPSSLAGTTTTPGEDDEPKKSKRKKNRHPPRAPTDTDAEDASLPAPPTSTSILTEPTEPTEPTSTAAKPPRKRSRESKFLGTVRTASERPPRPLIRISTSASPPPVEQKKREKKVKAPGGVLAALRGDGTEEREVAKPAPAPAAVVGEKKEEEKKVKTSVLKVVEVVRPKTVEGKKVDLASFLGSPMGSAGESLGGGGWD